MTEAPKKGSPFSMPSELREEDDEAVGSEHPDEPVIKEVDGLQLPIKTTTEVAVGSKCPAESAVEVGPPKKKKETKKTIACDPKAPEAAFVAAKQVEKELGLKQQADTAAARQDQISKTCPIREKPTSVVGQEDIGVDTSPSGYAEPPVEVVVEDETVKEPEEQ